MSNPSDSPSRLTVRPTAEEYHAARDLLLKWNWIYRPSSEEEYLYSPGAYLDYTPGYPRACLDGHFSTEQLWAILIYMKWHETQNEPHSSAIVPQAP